MKMKYWIGLALLACATLVKAEEIAVPSVINYQGRLTNPDDGSAIQAGVYHLEFRVWNDPRSTDASHLIWGRVFAVHVVTNGLFNILLTDDGAELSNPSPLIDDLCQAFQGKNRYLGLKITQGPAGIITAPEIQPRQKMVSSPFAFHAQNAVNSTQLGGVDASKYYDDHRFNEFGLGSGYARLLGWKSGGNAEGVGIYSYGGKICLTKDTPADPSSDTGLWVKDGNLKVSDAIVPSVGTGKGIQFPKNAGGGTGDAASLEYTMKDGEEGTLTLSVTNDANDNLVLAASGQVEIHGKVKAFGKMVEKVALDMHSTGTFFEETAPSDGFYYINADSAGFTVELGGFSWYLRADDHGHNIQLQCYPVAKGERFYVKYDDNLDGETFLKVYWRPVGL